MLLEVLEIKEKISKLKKEVYNLKAGFPIYSLEDARCLNHFPSFTNCIFL